MNFKITINEDREEKEWKHNRTKVSQSRLYVLEKKMTNTLKENEKGRIKFIKKEDKEKKREKERDGERERY